MSEIKLVWMLVEEPPIIPAPVCFRCNDDHICGETCPDADNCMPDCGTCDYRRECDIDEDTIMPDELGPEEAAMLPPDEDFKPMPLVAAYDDQEEAFIRPEPVVEDVVLHPNHYAEAEIPSGIECWDWYELAMTEEEITGHFKGNALKYIFRAGRKGDAIQDLEKARNYLARWIGYLKGDRTVHMRGKKNGSEV